MIFVSNKVPKIYYLVDNRLSQAGLIFQEKVSNSLEPELELSLIPSFIDLDKLVIENSSKQRFIVGCRSWYKKFRYLTYIHESFLLYFAIKKSDIKNVIYYNIDLHNILSFYLVNYFTDVKQYCIVADYSTTYSRFINKIFLKAYKKFSGVIVLNDNIKVNKNSILQPGITPESEIEIDLINVEKNGIIFSGSIGKTTGVELLSEAYEQFSIKDLTLSGRPYGYNTGDFEKIIEKFKKNPQFKYYGLLDYSDYKVILKNSFVALSLRNPSDEQHDYNFPSKILEYLSKGKMVISTKRYNFLPDNIIFYCDFETSSLVDCIHRVYNLTDLEILKIRSNIYKFLQNNVTEKSFKNNVQELLNNGE